MMLIGECCGWLWLKKKLQNHLIRLEASMYSFLLHQIQTNAHLTDATKIVQLQSKKKQLRGRKFCDKCFDFRLYLEVEKGKKIFSAFYKKQALMLKRNPPPPPPAPPLAPTLHLVLQSELLQLLLNLQGSVSPPSPLRRPPPPTIPGCVC